MAVSVFNAVSWIMLCAENITSYLITNMRLFRMENNTVILLQNMASAAFMNCLALS